jgi:hypothetical protein
MATRILTLRTTLLLCLMLALPAIAAAPALAAAPGYDLYFGDLHAHTGYSDGASGTTSWDAFPAAIAGGADFMALTEHYSTSNAYEPWTMSELEWADLKAAAAHYTSSRFVALPAHEYWLVADVGEINTYGIGELPPKQVFLGPDRLALYQEWIDARDGVGQFNHPNYVTHDFKNYAGWTADRDEAMGLIEVYNDGSIEPSYVKALDAGWHVLPSANSDTHDPDWIAGEDTRTVLLAPSLSAADLYAAMRAQRGYGTLDKNLHVLFSVNGGVMGSTLPPSSRYRADVRIWDPDALAGAVGDAVTKVEILSGGGAAVRTLTLTASTGSKTISWRPSLPADGEYFWVRVTTVSADAAGGAPGVTAWTAPVWTGR